MAKEKVSKIYGVPRFGLIVGIFAVSIVVILALGWVFLKFDPLKMKTTAQHRTGMTILYTASSTRQ